MDSKQKMHTRVYKYGVVFDLPVARAFPQAAIDELFKANRLWNRLVEIHREHQGIYEQERRDVSDDYRYFAEAIDTVNEKINKAYDEDLKQARNEANSRDKTHPLISKVMENINDLKAQRKTLYEALKRPRDEAKKLIDSKTLEADFLNDIKSACLVDNSQIYAVIANEIQRNFRTARQKAFSDRSMLRFHRFDGTGSWHWRLRLSNSYAGRKVTADGVKWAELFASEKNGKLSSSMRTTRFVILGDREIGKGRKKAVRARATFVGKDKEKGKDALQMEFDIIMHRPIPADGQIQNVKLMRTRTGDQFKYHICFTVRLPEQMKTKYNSDIAIGIDLGFRQIEDNREDKYNPLKVAHIAYSDNRKEQSIITVNAEMTKRENLLVDIQSSLSKSAEELGDRIIPLLKGVILPVDYKHREKREKQIRAITHPRAKTVTLSYEQAYKLAKWIRFDTESGNNIFPENLLLLTDNWLENNKHNYRGMHGLRRRLLAWRDEMFKIEAAHLVKVGCLIAVEDIKLSKMIQRDKGSTELSNKALANRFLAAPARFIQLVKNAADREQIPFVKIPPKNTSKTCSNCGHINKNLASEEEWVCPSCNAKHNRDRNAAVNIARLGLKKVGKQE